MLFDRFAGIIERNTLDLKSIFDSAAIFDFRDTEPLAPPDYQTLSELAETFILPFDVVAIESKTSCCIIYDRNPEKIGIDKSLNFLIYSKIILQYNNNIAIWTVNKGTIKDIALVRHNGGFDNEISSTKDNINYGYSYLIDHEFIYGVKEKDNKLTPINFTKTPEIYYEAMAEKVIGHIEQILFFNTPDRFVVEVVPENIRKFNPKRITRTPDRPTYTLLTISEIQKKYGLGVSETIENRKSPSPHPRRRHYRILRSDKFTQKQGQKVLIPSTWVGKSEMTMGNKIYKIRFDI